MTHTIFTPICPRCNDYADTIAKLQARNAELKSELEEATKDVDYWKKKFEEIEYEMEGLKK